MYSRGSGIGRGTLPEVQNGSGDPLGGLEQVGRPSKMSGMGREVLPGVWDWSRDPFRVLRRVGSSKRSWTGRGSLGRLGTGWGPV